MLMVAHDHPYSRTRADDWLGKSVAPEVFPCYTYYSRTSGTARTKLNDDWIRYFKELNPSFWKWRYITGIQAGLFNTAGFPQLESLTCGGNWIRIRPDIKEVWGEEWFRIYTFNLNDPAPSAKDVNHFTHPWLVHHFVCITRDGRIVDPPPGQIYFPLVAKVPLWMPLDMFIT